MSSYEKPSLLYCDGGEKDINNIIIEVATEILSEEYREGYLEYLENKKRIRK